LAFLLVLDRYSNVLGRQAGTYVPASRQLGHSSFFAALAKIILSRRNKVASSLFPIRCVTDERRQNCEEAATNLRPSTVLCCLGRSPSRFLSSLFDTISFALANFDLTHRSRVATPSFLLHGVFHDPDKVVKNRDKAVCPDCLRAETKFARAKKFPIA